jgi:hypothetical protein
MIFTWKKKYLSVQNKKFMVFDNHVREKDLT